MAESFKILRPTDIMPNLKVLTESIHIVQAAYNIGDADSIKQVNLPQPWKPLGLRGDKMKLIAAEPNLGIVVKRYVFEQFADMVFQNHVVIAPFVDKYEAPFIMPLGQMGDAVIFPLLEVVETTKNDDWDQRMAHILQLNARERGTTLPVSSKFSRYKLSDGTYRWGDLFDDSSGALLMANKE